eukprot:6104187-Amphidinium_carterae.1
MRVPPPSWVPPSSGVAQVQTEGTPPRGAAAASDAAEAVLPRAGAIAASESVGAVPLGGVTGGAVAPGSSGEAAGVAPAQATAREQHRGVCWRRGD